MTFDELLIELKAATAAGVLPQAAIPLVMLFYFAYPKIIKPIFFRILAKLKSGNMDLTMIHERLRKIDDHDIRIESSSQKVEAHSKMIGMLNDSVDKNTQTLVGHDLKIAVVEARAENLKEQTEILRDELRESRREQSSILERILVALER